MTTSILPTTFAPTGTTTNLVRLGTPFLSQPRNLDELSRLGNGCVRKTDQEALRNSDNKG